MPTSVATRTLSALVRLAWSSMPPVDRMLTLSAGTAPSPARYRADVAQPHSGWMNSSASGWAVAVAASWSPLMPACTWHSPAQTCTLSLPVSRRTCAPRNWSGQNSTSVSAGMEATTSTALDDVQQMSVSALTSAVVFTYDTTRAPGCSAFQARNWAASIESASEQPARASGISTVFSGARIFAVSAMKCTPQKTIAEASERAAIRLSASESPVWSAMSWISGNW